MSIFSPPYLLYTIHTGLESIAIFGFFFRPSETLITPAPSAHGVIRQYALALLCLNLLIWTALWHRSALEAALTVRHAREREQLRRGFAASLSVYHVGVAVRTLLAIGTGKSTPPMFASVAVHVPTGLAFVWEACRRSGQTPGDSKAGRKR